MINLTFSLLNFVAAVLLLGNNVEACAVKASNKVSLQTINKRFEKKNRNLSSVNIVPFAKDHKNPSWEARLGNILLSFLPSKAGKVVLSIPARIKSSDYHPFGDGQSNALMDLDSTWKQKAFPVVGVETIKDGKTTHIYNFDNSLKVRSYEEKNLLDGWYEVRPDGWDTVFYFNFQTGSLPVQEFLKGVPTSLRIFPENRIAPNIAKIGKINAYEQLKHKDLGPGYNKDAWPSDNVHGRFPNKDGQVTAIGSVQTWGIKTQPNETGAFKNLYTCFESRNPALESVKELPRGVPSGAGWHLIGDSAESVLNTLSNSPIPFAVARTHGKANSAYEMGETITAVWLQTDEIQITRHGEFHWYLNPYEETVCTEIWVQNCVPSPTNNWGFNCN